MLKPCETTNTSNWKTTAWECVAACALAYAQSTRRGIAEPAKERFPGSLDAHLTDEGPARTGPEMLFPEEEARGTRPGLPIRISP